MDYGKVASDVIAAVGKDNLVAAAHCATRLRLVLKDDTKVDQKALDENPDVNFTNIGNNIVPNTEPFVFSLSSTTPIFEVNL